MKTAGLKNHIRSAAEKSKEAAHYVLPWSIFMSLLAAKPVSQYWSALAPLAVFLLFTKKIQAALFLKMSDAKIPDVKYEEDREIFRQADGLAKKAGVKGISLYVCPRTGFGAAADGNIIIGDDLWERERGFVIAHELSHIKNRDQNRALFLLIPGLLSVIMMESLVGIPAMYVYTWMASLSLARLAEYRADHDAVELTGDLDGAISNLEDTATNYPGFLRRVFSTHPPGVKRIRRLEEHFRADGKSPVADKLEMECRRKKEACARPTRHPIEIMREWPYIPSM